MVKKIIAEGNNPRIYWGTSTATAGWPHSAYFVPAVKMAQLLVAGCQLTVLLADIHSFLDSLKALIELLERRVDFYLYTITAVFCAVGI
ncbi:hypothetical protein CNMCM5623_007344 [Aspergillus felis]|uniref:Uncharacterized protein n=1 Tax=Aspergillus felis TaxID=1287682 RepID=A0A8H6PXE0_9EURO|nr:hypothetical protein CNMCM5623_007344 [Aspergillus felis]